jgi:hypothetical protein
MGGNMMSKVVKIDLTKAKYEVELTATFDVKESSLAEIHEAIDAAANQLARLGVVKLGKQTLEGVQDES